MRGGLGLFLCGIGLTLCKKWTDLVGHCLKEDGSSSERHCELTAHVAFCVAVLGSLVG